MILPFFISNILYRPTILHILYKYMYINWYILLLLHLFLYNLNIVHISFLLLSFQPILSLFSFHPISFCFYIPFFLHSLHLFLLLFLLMYLFFILFFHFSFLQITIICSLFFFVWHVIILYYISYYYIIIQFLKFYWKNFLQFYVFYKNFTFIYIYIFCFYLLYLHI